MRNFLRVIVTASFLFAGAHAASAQTMAPHTPAPTAPPAAPTIKVPVPQVTQAPAQTQAPQNTSNSKGLSSTAILLLILGGIVLLLIIFAATFQPWNRPRPPGPPA